jgi:predicted ester cyclase
MLPSLVAMRRAATSTHAEIGVVLNRPLLLDTLVYYPSLLEFPSPCLDRVRLSSSPSNAASDHHRTRSHRMIQEHIKSRYRLYIDCINDGTMETEMPKHCHLQVIHNDLLYTLAQYKDMIQSSKDAIPDLSFHIDTLISDVSSQKLAVRLLFTGTPKQNTAGVEPNGRQVSFSEHVFYQLEQGKIRQV